jgi:transposase-like protein
VPRRRFHAPEFKAQVALDALCSKKSLAEIAACYALHPVQVCQWKQQLIKRLPEVFGHGGSGCGEQNPGEASKVIAKLQDENAALHQELEWLKKKISQHRSNDIALAFGARASLYLLAKAV